MNLFQSYAQNPTLRKEIRLIKQSCQKSREQHACSSIVLTGNTQNESRRTIDSTKWINKKEQQESGQTQYFQSSTNNKSLAHGNNAATLWTSPQALNSNYSNYLLSDGSPEFDEFTCRKSIIDNITQNFQNTENYLNAENNQNFLNTQNIQFNHYPEIKYPQQSHQNGEKYQEKSNIQNMHENNKNKQILQNNIMTKGKQKVEILTPQQSHQASSSCVSKASHLNLSKYNIMTENDILDYFDEESQTIQTPTLQCLQNNQNNYITSLDMIKDDLLFDNENNTIQQGQSSSTVVDNNIQNNSSSSLKNIHNLANKKTTLCYDQDLYQKQNQYTFQKIPNELDTNISIQEIDEIQKYKITPKNRLTYFNLINSLEKYTKLEKELLEETMQLEKQIQVSQEQINNLQLKSNREHSLEQYLKSNHTNNLKSNQSNNIPQSSNHPIISFTNSSKLQQNRSNLNSDINSNNTDRLSLGQNCNVHNTNKTNGIEQNKSQGYQNNIKQNTSYIQKQNKIESQNQDKLNNSRNQNRDKQNNLEYQSNRNLQYQQNQESNEICRENTKKQTTFNEKQKNQIESNQNYYNYLVKANISQRSKKDRFHENISKLRLFQKEMRQISKNNDANITDDIASSCHASINFSTSPTTTKHKANFTQIPQSSQNEKLPKNDKNRDIIEINQPQECDHKLEQTKPITQLLSQSYDRNMLQCLKQLSSSHSSQQNNLFSNKPYSSTKSIITNNSQLPKYFLSNRLNISNLHLPHHHNHHQNQSYLLNSFANHHYNDNFDHYLSDDNINNKDKQNNEGQTFQIQNSSSELQIQTLKSDLEEQKQQQFNKQSQQFINQQKEQDKQQKQQQENDAKSNKKQEILNLLSRMNNKCSMTPSSKENKSLNNIFEKINSSTPKNQDVSHQSFKKSRQLLFGTDVIRKHSPIHNSMKDDLLNNILLNKHQENLRNNQNNQLGNIENTNNTNTHNLILHQFQKNIINNANKISKNNSMNNIHNYTNNNNLMNSPQTQTQTKSQNIKNVIQKQQEIIFQNKSLYQHNQTIKISNPAQSNLSSNRLLQHIFNKSNQSQQK